MLMKLISRLRRGAILAIGLIALLIVGFAAVSADPLVQGDKRINQIADFGGDALYCIDASKNPTNDSETFDHFELLNGNGDVLWTLDRATVEHDLGSIGYGWDPVLLGTGEGSFGTVKLYANAAEDGTPYFIFTGFDEYGKPNLITFYGCSPVGSALSASATEEPAPI